MTYDFSFLCPLLIPNLIVNLGQGLIMSFSFDIFINAVRSKLSRKAFSSKLGKAIRILLGGQRVASCL